MTMKSMLWGAPTSGDGAAAYTEAETTRLFRALVGGDPTNEGILWGVYNGFAVTGSATPVSVNTGAAFVYGYFVWDESTNSIAIPTPVVGTTGHRIVLRQSAAAKTVRLTLISSTDGVATLPAITQTAGTTWDTKVYGLTVTTGGVITLTDERTWCHFPTRVETAMVENNAITDALIRDMAGLSVLGRAANTTGDPADITAGSDGYVLLRSGTALGFGQVATDGITDLAVTSGKLGADAVIAGKIADGAVDTTATLADNIVDDTKVGNRVPQFYRRQGGDANNWATYGTTTYTPTTVRQQAGVLRMNWSGAGESSDFTVTFPVAFSYTPVVIAQVLNADYMYCFRIKSITSTTVTFRAKNVDGLLIGNDISIHWFAVGPE
jgi:hypothetical protein